MPLRISKLRGAVYRNHYRGWFTYSDENCSDLYRGLAKVVIGTCTPIVLCKVVLVIEQTVFCYGL